MMKLDDLIHVSGLPGLYKIGASRSNGIIIEDIDNGKSRFVSMRKHQFTPLGTVAIYTMTDTIELIKVFDRMSAAEMDTPLPDVKGNAKEVFGYFEKVLPEYDRDQVLVSDVKKIVKWYRFLKDRNIYPFATSEEE